VINSYHLTDNYSTVQDQYYNTANPIQETEWQIALRLPTAEIVLLGSHSGCLVRFFYFIQLEAFWLLAILFFAVEPHQVDDLSLSRRLVSWERSWVHIRLPTRCTKNDRMVIEMQICMVICLAFQPYRDHFHPQELHYPPINSFTSKDNQSCSSFSVTSTCMGWLQTFAVC